MVKHADADLVLSRRLRYAAVGRPRPGVLRMEEDRQAQIVWENPKVAKKSSE